MEEGERREPNRQVSDVAQDNSSFLDSVAYTT